MMRALAISLVLLLVGCSSPPPPPEVNWNGEAQALNTTLPQWQENNVIVPAPVVAGNWSRVLYGFQGDRETYTPDVFYAVAHSSAVLVAASPKGDYFAAKSWLRQHGAKGVIRYQSKNDCLTCNSVDIYLIR